jgi:hypothetical protein
MNSKLKQIIKDEVTKVINEIANPGGLKVDNYPIRIVKYTPTSRFQIAIINPQNHLVTATFGTQFPNERAAETFLCDNLYRIEKYFHESEILAEGIEGRFEIIDREIKCNI